MEWERNIQTIIRELDASIRNGESGDVTLEAIAGRLGYSEYYVSHRFREVSGMTIKEYLRERKLAFAVKDLRDTDEEILDIAVRYGFSSNASFSHAFRALYGMTPTAYRRTHVPLVLRTVLRPFDCYLCEEMAKGKGEEDMSTIGEVKSYFVRIPAHRFLHIRNYESIGYWDFWEKQSRIPGQDCETVCGILKSIKGALDDIGGEEIDASSGQLMAWINHSAGRICSWGIPLAEAYGIRLPQDYDGPVPEGMSLMDVPEGEYIVFEHGPFSFEEDMVAVEASVEKAMKEYDWEKSLYRLDLTEGRVFYFFLDEKRFFRYVRPVVKK